MLQIPYAEPNPSRAWLRKRPRSEPGAPPFGFQSGRWDVRRATWNDVAIAVYHDPRHPYNVDRMLAGAHGALAYATSEFGPYPYREVRIAEAPLYQSYARAFPALVPFSESLGFISDVRGPHATDPADADGMKTQEPIVLVDVTLPATRIDRVGNRAWVRFDHGATPLAARWYRQARQVLLQHFNPAG